MKIRNIHLFTSRTDLEENKSTRHRHMSIPSHEGLLFLGLHAIGLVEDGQVCMLAIIKTSLFLFFVFI